MQQGSASIEDNTIPKMIHYFWDGRPMGKREVRSIQAMQAANPEYDIWLWGLDERLMQPCLASLSKASFHCVSTLGLPRIMVDFLNCCHEKKHFCPMKDLIQLAVLFHEGGHFLDLDVEPIHFDRILVPHGLLFQENLNLSAISAMPKHPIVGHLCCYIQSIAKLVFENAGFSSFLFDGRTSRIATLLSTGASLTMVQKSARNKFTYERGMVKASLGITLEGYNIALATQIFSFLHPLDEKFKLEFLESGELCDSSVKKFVLIDLSLRSVAPAAVEAHFFSFKSMAFFAVAGMAALAGGGAIVRSLSKG